MKRIILITIAFVIVIDRSALCSNAQSAHIVTNWADIAYVDMVKILGPPADKTGYTIRSAPTNSWNHRELFEIYPKTDENLDVHIMDVTWIEGDCLLVANFHMVNGTNRCFLAKRLKRQIEK